MEDQNIEWKESWRDEYLKWICAFANTDGGKILIGKDDNGVIKGISNTENLLEVLPSKIKSHLGILVEVNHLKESGEKYLEIIVDKYPFPVSYKGRYFVRSGSTTQELKGNDLNKFLLEKVGKRWDAVPVPNLQISELSASALKRFREKAVKSNRVDKEVLDDTDHILIENLRLFDGNLLKRAAILLFHPDPEEFISGSFIKIGFFKTDDDLAFQDEVHGNLMEQIDESYDLLITKYSTNNIDYEGLSRVEKPPFPKAAIREALLNAIAHKDYSEPTPIQISVYPNKIIFWNPGQLSDKLSLDQLRQKHPSIPNNPDLANSLSRCGDIESWGRGTLKMINECVRYQLLPPEFELKTSGFVVEIYNEVEARLKLDGLDNQLIAVVKETLASGRITNDKVQEVCDVSKATATRYLDKLEGLYLDRVGGTGRGTYYVIKGLIKGS